MNFDVYFMHFTSLYSLENKLMLKPLMIHYGIDWKNLSNRLCHPQWKCHLQFAKILLWSYQSLNIVKLQAESCLDQLKITSRLSYHQLKFYLIANRTFVIYLCQPLIYKIQRSLGSWSCFCQETVMFYFLCLSVSNLWLPMLNWKHELA